METLHEKYYLEQDYVIPTFYDKLLNQNYFDNKMKISDKSLYDYGAN
jgi:hypothetical protein